MTYSTVAVGVPICTIACHWFHVMQSYVNRLGITLSIVSHNSRDS